MSEEIRLKDIAKIKNQLSELNEKLSLAYQNTRFPKSVAKEDALKSSTESKVTTEGSAIDSQTASVIDAITPEESSGIIDRLLQTLKHFFFRTQ